MCNEHHGRQCSEKGVELLDFLSGTGILKTGFNKQQ